MSKTIFCPTFQFNLICEDAPLRALFHSAFYIGGMIGSFLSGILGDKLVLIIFCKNLDFDYKWKFYYMFESK